MINSTLCYIENNGSYLMMYRNKKNDDPNAGKWIGVGGKFESGETALNCVTREVLEETGLSNLEFCFRGMVHFRSDCWEDEEMYLYTASMAKRPVVLQDCDEGSFEWIHKEAVLSLQLWEGDYYFLSELLSDSAKPDKNADIPFDITLRYEGDKLIEVTRGKAESVVALTNENIRN